MFAYVSVSITDFKILCAYNLTDVTIHRLIFTQILMYSNKLRDFQPNIYVFITKLIVIFVRN